MMWETSKIRNITLMERILKAKAFLKIGPEYDEAKTLKSRICDHLSDPHSGEDDLNRLVDAVNESFLPDYQCSHTEQVSERNSECARKRGKAFITDCECDFCEAVNAVWLGDVWGSGVEITPQEECDIAVADLSDALEEWEPVGPGLMMPSNATPEQVEAAIEILTEESDDADQPQEIPEQDSEEEESMEDDDRE